MQALDSLPPTSVGEKLCSTVNLFFHYLLRAIVVFWTSRSRTHSAFRLRSLFSRNQESAAKKQKEYQAKVRARHGTFAQRQHAAVVPAFAKDIMNASRKIGDQNQDDVFAEFQANQLAAAVYVPRLVWSC